MGKFTKRKKSYYLGPNKRRRLECVVGTVGFLGTCNSYEDAAIKEGYDLLNHYATKLYGLEEPYYSATPAGASGEKHPAEILDSSDEEEDIEGALQKEVASLQAPNPDSNSRLVRRFLAVRCTANNNVYFRTLLPDPVPTLVMAMEDILATKQQCTKHLIRLLPVHAVCKAYIDKIDKAFTKFVTERFQGKNKTFFLQVKVISNSSIRKDELLGVAVKVLQELAPDCRPVLTKDADVAVIVSILFTNCYIGEAPLYLGKYKKYNLMELASPDREASKAESIPTSAATDKSADSACVGDDAQKDKMSNELVTPEGQYAKESTTNSVSEKVPEETTNESNQESDAATAPIICAQSDADNSVAAEALSHWK